MVLLVLHEEQLVAEQPAHPELPADVVVWVCPPGPWDLETKPHLDICLSSVWLLHAGHSGLKLPMTRVSKFLPQSLHLYS